MRATLDARHRRAQSACRVQVLWSQRALKRNTISVLHGTRQQNCEIGNYGSNAASVQAYIKLRRLRSREVLDLFALGSRSRKECVALW